MMKILILGTGSAQKDIIEYVRRMALLYMRSAMWQDILLKSLRMNSIRLILWIQIGRAHV